MMPGPGLKLLQQQESINVSLSLRTHARTHTDSLTVCLCDHFAGVAVECACKAKVCHLGYKATTASSSTRVIAARNNTSYSNSNSTRANQQMLKTPSKAPSITVQSSTPQSLPW
jgi:hypothetical protein